MTTASKIKIYLEFWNMAKDWDFDMLYRRHVQCCKFRDDVALHCFDVYYQMNNIQDRVICDLIYRIKPELFEDYLPYCFVLNLEKVIDYGVQCL